MKLSTFCKLVKKEYLSDMKDLDPITQQTYLCNRVSSVTYKLTTKHPAQEIQYLELDALCKQFILSQIGHKETVYTYLASMDMPRDFEICHKFRLNLLEDMIDWAEAQEGDSK